jgi:DNA-binding transcriptional MerR regulator
MEVYMELQTISQVSKQFRISTRTLRYYEQIGLIQSTMKEDYSYRTYDEGTVLRLKQIIVLRKLRIPLKSIAEILLTENTALAIEVFQQSLNEIGDELTALTTIKSVIQTFIERLNIKNAKLQLLDDESLLDIVDSLTTSKINLQEDKTMVDLIKADEKLNKLADRNVRIVYLPPSGVAAYQYEGDDPEMHVLKVVDAFVRKSNITTIKPDLRHYGFNSPNPVDETGHHGYEVWVTIPDSFSVPEPLVKKHFEGGLYAAHMIPFGAFDEWGLLNQWIENNGKYEFRSSGDYQNMFGLMEEHLNYVNRVDLDDPEEEGCQLDLLLPIKDKRKG